MLFRSKRLSSNIGHILCYELDELKEASITPGEEARLSKEWKRLSEREHIITAYQELTSLLGYESNGACDLCGRAEHALKGISDADEEAQSLYDQLTDAESIIHDICREASERLDAMQDEELDTAKIEERLDQIRHLIDRKSTRLNSSHNRESRMPSSA